MNVIKPFKIRDIEINPPLVLSPMAGVTDISFRRLLKARGGIGLTVSEFISVEGLTRNNPKSKRQRSEEHTSELQSLTNLVCRLLLEKKKQTTNVGSIAKEVTS